MLFADAANPNPRHRCTLRQPVHFATLLPLCSLFALFSHCSHVVRCYYTPLRRCRWCRCAQVRGAPRIYFSDVFCPCLPLLCSILPCQTRLSPLVAAPVALAAVRTQPSFSDHAAPLRRRPPAALPAPVPAPIPAHHIPSGMIMDTASRAAVPVATVSRYPTFSSPPPSAPVRRVGAPCPAPSARAAIAPTSTRTAVSSAGPVPAPSTVTVAPQLQAMDLAQVPQVPSVAATHAAEAASAGAGADAMPMQSFLPPSSCVPFTSRCSVFLLRLV